MAVKKHCVVGSCCFQVLCWTLECPAEVGPDCHKPTRGTQVHWPNRNDQMGMI